MKTLLIALTAALSTLPHIQPDATRPVSKAHAEHLRTMLDSDGNIAVVDISIKHMRDTMVDAAAKSRNEVKLTADEEQRFDRIAQPVLERLKQRFVAELTEGYSALSDQEIDELIRANDTPLGRRFITLMVQNLAGDEIKGYTYAAETAEGISFAYAHNAAYAPKGIGSPDRKNSPEGRLFVETGNDMMIDEGVQDYLGFVVGDQVTGVDFERLSDNDSARLRALFSDGLRDLADRIKALKLSALHDAFSPTELEALNRLYALPAMQAKTRVALAMVPEGRKRNFAAGKSAYDEVLAAFANTAAGK